MLAALACLIGVFGLLIIAELFGRYRLLKGEFHRKFLHITAGSFIAFWPWLIDWWVIELFAVGALVLMIANHYLSFLNYRGRVGRATYGDIFLALAILLSAVITHQKIFFMVAILGVSIADGLAAVAGIAYGKNWVYKVWGNKKTVIGTMVFWLSSVCVLGLGLLPAHNLISFKDYFLILTFLPPVLTLVENIGAFGLDNLAIPLLTIILLKAAQLN